MRRLLLTAAGLTALTLSAPAAALAGHGHHHRHKRGGHHAKVRFQHIGPAGTSTTGSDPGSVTGPGAGNPPVTPPANENAAKVASYKEGLLTLTLNDGSSVSGKVTNHTHIECVGATGTPPSSGQGNDNGPGDNEGARDDSGAGEDNHQGNQHEGDQQSPAQGTGAPSTMRGEDDEGQAPSSEPPCDTSALVPGAIVREAELRIGSSGTEFESIVLVR